MVVFLSDVHMTDGSSGETIKPTAFRIFAGNIRKPVYTVKPIEGIQLYILKKGSSYQTHTGASFAPFLEETSSLVNRMANEKKKKDLSEYLQVHFEPTSFKVSAKRR